MANQLDQTVQSLRELVLAGRYATGEKLGEQGLSDDLAVSRTLVRLALAELEREGLVSREPNRGFRVRSFTLAEVVDAIMVRAELESMAARLCAERGLSAADMTTLEELIEEMNAAVADGFGSVDLRARWIEMNGAFHDTLLRASGNSAIQDVVAHLSNIPLVSARALVFDQSDAELSRTAIVDAHKDHLEVLEAIRNHEGQRAAFIMREHARKAAVNKQKSYAAMKERMPSPPLPGLRLVQG